MIVVHSNGRQCGQSQLESRPVLVEELEEYVVGLHANNNIEFGIQYEVYANLYQAMVLYVHVLSQV